MFNQARIQLTLWYVFIAFLLTCLFSLLAYNGFRFEFERGLQRQRIFFQQNLLLPTGVPSMMTFGRMDPKLQDELREHLILRIMYIDGAVILIATIGGYFLAVRTLKPIQIMMDEQKRFITDASHELRTPLTALRAEMEASMLDDTITVKDAKSLIKSNLEEVISLQRLSDSLLDLTGFNAQTTGPKLQRIKILPIIEDSLKKVRPLAKEKSITISTRVKDVAVMGAPHELTQLFIILLDNAIKYSSKGSSVTISSTIKDGEVEVAIKDTGIGIPQNDISQIFNRFYRSDKSRTKTMTSGYGLGLAIADTIVKRHKGAIKIKSIVDKGSTFTVVLPAKTI